MNKTNIKDLDFNYAYIIIEDIDERGDDAKCIFRYKESGRPRQHKKYKINIPNNWDTTIEKGDEIYVVKCKRILKSTHLSKEYYRYSLWQVDRYIENTYADYLKCEYKTVDENTEIIGTKRTANSQYTFISLREGSVSPIMSKVIGSIVQTDDSYNDIDILIDRLLDGEYTIDINDNSINILDYKTMKIIGNILPLNKNDKNELLDILLAGDYKIDISTIEGTDDVKIDVSYDNMSALRNMVKELAQYKSQISLSKHEKLHENKPLEGVWFLSRYSDTVGEEHFNFISEKEAVEMKKIAEYIHKEAYNVGYDSYDYSDYIFEEDISDPLVSMTYMASWNNNR